MLDLCSLGARRKAPSTEQSLRPHDIENKDLVSVEAIKDTAWWLHDLAIPRPSQLLWPAATLRMVRKLLNVAEDALDERGSGDGVFQRDVICDSIKIA